MNSAWFALVCCEDASSSKGPRKLAIWSILVSSRCLSGALEACIAGNTNNHRKWLIFQLCFFYWPAWVEQQWRQLVRQSCNVSVLGASLVKCRQPRTRSQNRVFPTHTTLSLLKGYQNSTNNTFKTVDVEEKGAKMPQNNERLLPSFPSSCLKHPRIQWQSWKYICDVLFK